MSCHSGILSALQDLDHQINGGSDPYDVSNSVFALREKQVHLVENVQRRDEKYWLPGQPEEAYFCVRVRASRLYRGAQDN